MLINYESILCYCRVYFSTLMLSDIYFCVLFAIRRESFSKGCHVEKRCEEDIEGFTEYHEYSHQYACVLSMSTKAENREAQITTLIQVVWPHCLTRTPLNHYIFKKQIMFAVTVQTPIVYFFLTCVWWISTLRCHSDSVPLFRRRKVVCKIKHSHSKCRWWHKDSQRTAGLWDWQWRVCRF